MPLEDASLSKESDGTHSTIRIVNGAMPTVNLSIRI
ncbi:MAG: hypothetical protein ACLT2S_09285 [Christensenellales bacterium]